MAKVPGEPYTGALTIDATSLGGIVFDLPRGATQHLRTERHGIDGVVNELSNQVPTSGEAAGIAPKVYAHFVECTDNIGKLRVARRDLEKLLEVIKESEAKYTDERENDISIMSDAVRSVVKRTGNEAVQAPFEKMLRYNAQVAEKAAKTRRANAAAGAEEETEPQG